MSSPAQDPEQVVARLRPHGRVLFWPSLILIATVEAIDLLHRQPPGGVAEHRGVRRRDAGDPGALAAAAGGLAGHAVHDHDPPASCCGTASSCASGRSCCTAAATTSWCARTRCRACSAPATCGSTPGLEHPVVLRDVPGADLVQGVLHDLMERSLNPIAARRQAESAGAPDETRVWGVR